MRDEIGGNLVTGIAVGINKKKNSAINAMKDLSDSIISPAAKALSNFNSSNGAGMGMARSVDNSKTISFTQVNNSPKALSRLEIYRQTRNQLALLKEV